MKALPIPTLPPGRHPIAVVSERTGLSQDVLRIWERRYKAVQPDRAADGKRRYSDADIVRLSLMRAATAAGRNVGAVAKLTTAELAVLVEEDTEAQERRAASSTATSDADTAVHESMLLVRALDGALLDQRLRRAASLLGISVFLECVAAPLLRRLGEEWHEGRLTPPQEHLASAILHDIAMQTMRTFGQRNGGARLLVATPAGDRHAIGAALIGAVAAVNGWEVIYLGVDLPAADIAGAAVAANVRLVALSIIYMDDPDRVLREVGTLRSMLPREITIVAGGAGAGVIERRLMALGVNVETTLPGWTATLRRQQNG